MLIEYIIDGVLLILLGAVIVSSYLLNNRILEVRKGQTELAGLVQRLNIATQQAQSGVELLKKASKETKSDLEAEVTKARALADELALITQSGENIASRIEKGLSQTETGGKAGAPKSIKVDLEESITEEEEAVLQALKEAR